MMSIVKLFDVQFCYSPSKSENIHNSCLQTVDETSILPVHISEVVSGSLTDSNGSFESIDFKDDWKRKFNANDTRKEPCNNVDGSEPMAEWLIDIWYEKKRLHA